MIRYSFLTKFFALSLTVLAVTGCDSLQQAADATVDTITNLDEHDPFRSTPLNNKEQLINQERETVDPKLVTVSNEALGAISDRSKPIMTQPPRPNAGVLGEVSFDNSKGGTKALRRSGSYASDDIKKVEIDFADVSLRALIELIFDEYILAPYTFLPDFEDKKVNWIASGEFTERQIFEMFQAFLDLHNVKIAENAGVYAISSKDLVSSAGQAMIGQTVGVWRLRFLDVKDALPIVRQFASKPESIQFFDASNILVASASAAQIRNIQYFLRSVDVSYFEGKSMMIYGPRFLTAQAVVSLLQNLPKRLGLDLKEGKNIVEAEVVNGEQRVVVVTDGADTRAKVIEYLEQIDQPGENRPQVFFYPVRNQKAEEIRSTISSLLPNFLPDGEEINIVANTPTNSLLITASADQYFEIKKVIDRLDFQVPSVLIDATIVEVQLRDSLAYGVEWFLSSNINDVAFDIANNLTNASAVSAATGAAASRIGVVSLNSNAFATLDLLAGKTDLRVLSRPRVLVKNLSTATIKSTDEIRVVSAELTTDVQQDGSNIPQREFESKEVGVSLEVTPKISDDGSISMLVEIEDSRQGAPDLSSGSSQPTFNIRQVNTELIVNNGETIMIGGLIRREETRDKSKVPFFGDLPIIGHAFSNQTDSTDRTELIVFITPHVVMDKYAARIVSEAISGINVAPLGEKISTEKQAEVIYRRKAQKTLPESLPAPVEGPSSSNAMPSLVTPAAAAEPVAPPPIEAAPPIPVIKEPIVEKAPVETSGEAPLETAPAIMPPPAPEPAAPIVQQAPQAVPAPIVTAPAPTPQPAAQPAIAAPTKITQPLTLGGQLRQIQGDDGQSGVQEQPPQIAPQPSPQAAPQPAPTTERPVSEEELNQFLNDLTSPTP